MIRAIVTAFATAIASPAFGSGLGPLEKAGVTDGEAKAFYLTLMNPYDRTTEFEVLPLGMGNEVADHRVTVFPAHPRLGPRKSRKILVIVRPLEPGETHQFRVCAARRPDPKDTVYARVCSKLSARRLDVTLR